jgi:hypothetical protein
MMGRVAVLVTALGMTLGAVGVASAAVKVWQARLRFLPSGQPALHLQVNSAGELRIADSAAGLTTAKPIWAEHRNSQSPRSGELWQSFDFAEMTLPVSPPGTDRTKVSFYFYRSRQREKGKGPLVETASFSGRFTIWRKDGEGKRWTYELTPPVSAGKDSMDIQVPDLGHLSLAVVTKIEGKKARIALQVKGGDPKTGIDIENVKKSGKSVACTMEVVDKDGKVVHSARGDLTKFGFT